MRFISLIVAGLIGTVLGGVGCFLVLNLIGFVAYYIERPSDEGLDTALFYWSILSLPYAAAAGGLAGIMIAWIRQRRTSPLK